MDLGGVIKYLVLVNIRKSGLDQPGGGQNC